MTDHPRAAVQRPEGVDTFIVPLTVGLWRPAPGCPGGLETEMASIEGTGFLVANGRGLGITARHVAVAVQALAPPVADVLANWPPRTELRVASAGFIRSDSRVVGAP